VNTDKQKNATISLNFQTLQNYAIVGANGSKVMLGLQADGGRGDVFLKRINSTKEAKFAYSF